MRIPFPTRSAALLLLLLAVIEACAPSSASPTSPASATPAAAAASPSPAGDRVAGWRSDLALLVPGMARLHPALDHGTTRADLDTAAAALSGRAPTATDDEMLVGVLRVVAMVSAQGCDGHTGAYVWGDGSYHVESLPLRLWYFDEGIVVIDALPPYRELIGWRIDTINGRSMQEVLAAVEPIVPRDNEATVRLLIPRFLLIPEILRGLGIAGSGPVRLALSRGADHREIPMTSMPMRDYNAWAGAYGLFLPSDPDVLYLSRLSDTLWWRSLEDGAVLYVQYNRVDRLPQASLESLRSALHAPGIDKVIVDIRHNFGGEVSAVDPMVKLFEDPVVDRPRHLFVITGRNTFSAAGLFLARLDASTSALVVGEPMAGCPTAFGNARPFALPFSGISVSVSTVLEVGVSAEDHRSTIEPELPSRLSLDAWLKRDDPALASIRGYRP